MRRLSFNAKFIARGRLAVRCGIGRSQFKLQSIWRATQNLAISCSMPPDDVSLLISRIALKDREAFRALYSATSAKLFGVCLRVLKNRAEAEEVLQDIYVKIWLNADKYQVSGYSPITWLVAISRNLCIDRLRARRPAADEISEALEIADQSATPEQTALLKGETGRLVNCLEQLHPERAMAVKAAYMEGHSYQDLAALLGQPLNTVRTWLRRSLISLRKCLSS